MTEYHPPDARIVDADFDWEAASKLDIAPLNPIKALARTETSRRNFIKGVVVSGAAISAAGYVFRGAGTGIAKAATPAASSRMIGLKINGKTRRVDVLPQDTLLSTLRYKLNLTGTKLGCDRGECGACTVLIDGVPQYSCSVLARNVGGREVTTVEGLAGPGGKLSPLQSAFVKELAPQCGFCTPGQLMSATALLRANPKPTRDQVRQAMSGNLCRCGAYEHYTNAIMRAAKET